MRRRVLVLFVVVALIGYGNGVARGEDSPEKAAQQAAQKAAEAWMPLWDSGKWEESYKELAESTRSDNTPRQWYVYWYGVRKPLGKVKSRKLVEAKYIKSLPGSPDQSGVTLRYESSFENKDALVETFAVLLEKDGTWRVAFYITP